MSESALPVEIVEEGNIRGRGLHATRRIAAGEVIGTFSALLLLPAERYMTSICTHCFKAGSPSACTRCWSAYYCDSTCQRANWAAVHSKECRPLQRMRSQAPTSCSGHLPTPARLLLQILVKDSISKAVQTLVGNYTRPGYRVSMEMETRKDIELMAIAACKYAGKAATEEQIDDAVADISRLHMNAFHRHDEDLADVGVFLEPMLAMANHSCIPNAFVQFIGRDAVLRSLQPIEAGDAVEISYTDYTRPLFERRQGVEAYCFECRCRRCVEDLSVYQVCASSPKLEHDIFSLAPEAAQYKGQTPMAMMRTDASLKAQIDTIGFRRVDFPGFPSDLDQRHERIRHAFRQCEVLPSRGLWALAPLAQVLAQIPIYYAERGDFAASLATACIVATESDPYRLVAPFDPARLKGLLAMARCLSNTANGSLGSLGSYKGEPGRDHSVVQARISIQKRIREELQNIDQVALCQMLLMMIVRFTRQEPLPRWEIAVSAREMLEEITQLPGRDKELSLINAWDANPKSAQSQDFFQFAVINPVQSLSELGKELVKLDFGH